MEKNYSTCPVNSSDQPLNYYTPVVLNIRGDLDTITKDWILDEISKNRRIVMFNPSWSGYTITTTFSPIALEERPRNSICISCIFWEAKHDYFVTSFDIIYLLEQLVAVIFNKEEKSRIRRNLEEFRPLTVSKAKPDTAFFKLIMEFPSPKPCSIENNIKVFPWKSLVYALEKVISKYSASPSSTLPPSEQTDVSLMDYDDDDDLGSPSMDGSEYADANAEERISNPRTYFKKLVELEHEIYEISSVWICKRNPAGEIQFSPADSRCRILPLDERAMNLQRSIESLNKKLQSPLLLCLLECHNMVQRSYYNVQKMQEAGFCGGYISVLVQKSDRIGVANLFRIDAIKIMRLYKNLEATLQVLGLTGPHNVHKFASNKNNLGTFLIDYAENINLSCEDILNSIGLRCAPNYKWTELWQRTTQVVDFAILSYVGVHIERFDIKFLDKDISCFRFSDSGPFYDEQAKADMSLIEVQDAALSYDDATKLQCNSYWPPYTLRRRRLQCLDNLLGGMEVWVFHQSQNDVQDDTRLCLSTDVETLTDIWGPLWKIMRESSPSQIERLDIGNGSIVPWASHPNFLAPDIRLGEVYCHWIPHKRWNSMDIEEHQKGLERNYYLDTDKLLIGAKEDDLLTFSVSSNSHSMEGIRRKIASSLEKKSAEAYKMTFEIEWDPLAFVKEQEYREEPHEAIAIAITLTGSAIDAQALTCAQYLYQTWPSTGNYTIRLVKDVLRSGPGYRHICDLPNNTKLTAWIYESKFMVEAFGTGDSVTEIGEQLAWLGAALRSSPYELGIANCTPFISNIRDNVSHPVSATPCWADILCKIDFNGRAPRIF